MKYKSIVFHPKNFHLQNSFENHGNNVYFQEMER